MNTYVDLHIHSCLSPCGDEGMTPNNLSHMAKLKGLQLIAVSDHNTAKNLPAVAAVCERVGVKLLPAMELTTREEVHMLAYFPDVKTACAFSERIYPYLPDIQNRPEFFGRQLIMDDQDEIIGEEPKLLLQALDIPIDELTAMIREAGGLAVPAHVNRGSNGLLNVLGFLSGDEDYAALEVDKSLDCPRLPKRFLELHASDAHRLEDIFERVERLDLPTPDAQGFFARFSQ